MAYRSWKEPVKTCFLPTCRHDDVKNPGMRFFTIRKELRERWCLMVGRKCPKRPLFCCEDHINMEEDLENYERWIYGAKPRLKLNAIPKNIPERKATILGDTKHRSANIPQAHTSNMDGATSSVGADISIPCHRSDNIPQAHTSNMDGATSSGGADILIPSHVCDDKPRKCPMREPILNPPPTPPSFHLCPLFQVDAAVQCESAVLKNKSVMIKPNTKDKSTNFRARNIKKSVMPSLSSQLPDSGEGSCQSPSLFGTSNIDSSSSTSVMCNQKLGRERMLKIIKNKPKTYLGVPKNFWWFIDFMVQQYSCLALHIIMTLFKIKNNDSFVRMSDSFEMTRSTIRSLFEKNVVILATYFQNFVYLPSPIEIKKNLPLVFKIRYSSVQCIIDCFEIQIEKPSDPRKQVQTWSAYKSCNTIKYLLGCTPAGLISFISKGYGGRISDKKITDKSGIIDVLPVNAIIMADRGFKDIESLLSVKNIKLLRPPSVYHNKNMTKKQVMETKVIASLRLLRVHVERVIKKVREFHMLKPHAVLHNKHVKYLDDIVTIACGLINLQEPIINEN